MKKQILATIMILAVSAFAVATAGEKKEAAYTTSKTVTVKPSFSKLVVDGNVDVVLYEDNSVSEIRTFGTSADIAATSITEKNGVLTIYNKKTTGEKVLVYVPVRSLSVIEASGNSKITSASVLESTQLTIVVKGECKFNIRSAGNIEVTEEGEGEAMVERKNITLQYTSPS